MHRIRIHHLYCGPVVESQRFKTDISMNSLCIGFTTRGPIYMKVCLPALRRSVDAYLSRPPKYTISQCYLGAASF